MFRRNRPIKGKGFGILYPVLIVLFLFSFSINQLIHVSGKPFHIPAIWEILIAGLLGTLFGIIMLTQTSYEIRDDGFIYPKHNPNFKFVILAIIGIRMGLSQYFKNLEYTEFMTLTFVLAFIYICFWRVGSYLKFRKLYLETREAETRLFK